MERPPPTPPTLLVTEYEQEPPEHSVRPKPKRSIDSGIILFSRNTSNASILSTGSADFDISADDTSLDSTLVGSNLTLLDSNSSRPDSNSSMPNSNFIQPDSNSNLPDFNPILPDYNSRLSDSIFRLPDSHSSPPDTSFHLSDSNSRLPDSHSSPPDSSFHLSDSNSRLPTDSNSTENITTTAVKELAADELENLQESGSYLNVPPLKINRRDSDSNSQSRRDSNCSASSDVSDGTVYHTAPSTPYSISRSMSLESSSSTVPSPTLKDTHIKMEVNVQPSTKMLTVSATAEIDKEFKLLKLSLDIYTTSSLKNIRKRSPSSPVTLSRDFPIITKDGDRHSRTHSPAVSPSLPKKQWQELRTRNRTIERVVRKNIVEFVKSTHLEALTPHLFSTDLISRDDYDEMQGMNGRKSKNNYFYMLLLCSKGADAYTHFYECLKGESEHRGHRDLVKIIKLGLQECC